jgi:hypothetical protein
MVLRSFLLAQLVILFNEDVIDLCQVCLVQCVAKINGVLQNFVSLDSEEVNNDVACNAFCQFAFENVLELDLVEQRCCDLVSSCLSCSVMSCGTLDLFAVTEDICSCARCAVSCYLIAFSIV